MFLTYCLLKDAPALSCEDQRLTEANLQAVVNFGRKPDLELQRDGSPVSLKTWADEIFAELVHVAQYMDKANGSNVYLSAIKLWRKCISDPNKTLSGQFLYQLKQNQQDGGSYAIELANEYKLAHQSQTFVTYSNTSLDADAVASHEAQQQKVSEDNLTFVAFLDDYFANA